MISQQLRQLRLARGLSLEGLAQQMGGVVTKQALSKYEQGKANPTPVILTKLAAALGVKTADLVRQPSFSVEFIAYRKRAAMGKREQEQVQSRVAEAMQQRVRLQQIIGQRGDQHIPIQGLHVETLDDAERAAEQLRQQWNVGVDPIANLTAVLEDHAIHVVELEADETFDGIAAVARDGERRVLAATVVTRRGVPGERQRLSLAHEVGHLVLDPVETLDGEQAAFRFGAALLAPAQIVQQRVGTRRGFIQLAELILLKQFFGVSIQALLRRLRDLGIITDAYYKQWCIDINRLGLRRHEPAELPPEQSQWIRRNVLRAASEALISAEEASLLLGEPLDAREPPMLLQRRAFLSLPLEERRRILAEQAQALQDTYADDPDRELWQGGGILDDEATPSAW
jgi:transcriptional regulator with XRE-family HTH domain/Zn-dependent peptidase ImmA (M78 family)